MYEEMREYLVKYVYEEAFYLNLHLLPYKFPVFFNSVASHTV
jgi:hypothetical protein